MARKSGVLMHVSSLHGEYGIGSFGNEAIEFIDFLSDCGFSLWQTLPFCMVDEYNSPYKSYSAFGANPYFIDLPTLYSKGLLTKAELDAAKQRSPYLCEYERLGQERTELLFLAASRAYENPNYAYQIEEFIKDSQRLLSLCEFLTLREQNGGKPWQRWNIKTPDKPKLFGWKFIQYEFFTQWQKIKAYANKKGVSIIGDLPIYVSLDSADVWSEPSNFLLDEDGYPTAVAGVPPDYFSADGQLWGNPIYNYKKMKSDGYTFWHERMEHALTLFDGVRIDHFRAFESYWSIPGDACSARVGKWIKGPGRALIDVIKNAAKGRFVIAEDLGDITKKVEALRSYSGFPGMRVLEFAFLGDESSTHLPHNFDKNTVAYTSTHDNNTLLGYIWELDEPTRARVFDYFGFCGKDFSYASEHIIKALLASCADTVILPIQDLLLHGCDTRMNTPGKACGNWAYRITKEHLSSINTEKYRHLNGLYGRKNSAAPS